MSLTIPYLPDSLSAALEQRAKAEGRPLTDVALEALAKGLNLPEKTDGRTLPRDLSGIAGSMSEADARAIEETVRWMDEGDLAGRS